MRRFAPSAALFVLALTVAGCEAKTETEVVPVAVPVPVVVEPVDGGAAPEGGSTIDPVVVEPAAE